MKIKIKGNKSIDYLYEYIYNIFLFFYFFRQRQAILISPNDYARFLKQEIQLTRYDEIIRTKAAEIKRLQSQVSYYKKQSSHLRKNLEEDSIDNKIPKVN